MRKLIYSLCLLAATSACAYHGPTEPTITTAAATAAAGTPTTLELAVTPGQGVTGGTATIGVHVMDPFGAPLRGLTVSLTSSAGTLTPSELVTDGGGRGTSVLTAPAGSITVTASVANGPTRAAPVSIQPATPLPPATPTPAPGPTPTDPTPAPLTVTILVTAAQAGQATTFQLVTQALASASWTFGDGATATTGSGFTSHVYAAAGTYPVTVMVTDMRGRTASTTQTVTIPAPPPPPTPAPTPATPPSITVKVTCTAAPHNSLSSCNLTATDQDGTSVTTLYATKGNVKWDFGDGTADALSFGAQMQHTYTQVGTYKVEATVFGPNNLIGRGSVDLVINQ